MKIFDSAWVNFFSLLGVEVRLSFRPALPPLEFATHPSPMQVCAPSFPSPHLPLPAEHPRGGAEVPPDERRPLTRLRSDTRPPYGSRGRALAPVTP